MSEIVYELKKYRGDSDKFILFKTVSKNIEYFQQSMYLLVGNIKSCDFQIVNDEVISYIRLYKDKSTKWMKDNILFDADYSGIRIVNNKRTLIKINNIGVVTYLQENQI